MKKKELIYHLNLLEKTLSQCTEDSYAYNKQSDERIDLSEVLIAFEIVIAYAKCMADGTMKPGRELDDIALLTGAFLNDRAHRKKKQLRKEANQRENHIPSSKKTKRPKDEQ